MNDPAAATARHKWRGVQWLHIRTGAMISIRQAMILLVVQLIAPRDGAILTATKAMQLEPLRQAMTSRRATDNAEALDAFMTTKFRIDAILERLRARSDDHFKTHPDEIN